MATRQIAYYIVFLSIVLAALPYLFDRYLGEPLFSRADHPWLGPTRAARVGGAVIFGAGLVGYTVCSAWLVVVGRGPFVEFDPPKHFVATGPYRVCRNPIQVCLVAATFGEAVFFGSPGIFAFVLCGIVFAWYQVARVEEPLLRERFGDSYLQYCRRVPRWLPFRRRPRCDRPVQQRASPPAPSGDT